ncbi:MAG: FAD-dependent oxidoreductase [bacterium]|nr:FAD-dependent oxidoreductase [bacterium]
MKRSSNFDAQRRNFLRAIAGGLFLGSPTSLAIGETRSAAAAAANVDFAVLGAGPFGAAAAMHLAQAGAGSVALIGPPERADVETPAQRFASHYDESRNATAMDSDIEWAGLALRSVEPIRDLEKRTGIAIFSEVGSLRVTQAPFDTGYFDLAGIRASASRLEVPLAELETQELNARFSEARFDAGSLGLLQERGAGLINPRRLVRALRRVATELGAIWLDDEVDRIEPKAGGVEISTRSGRSLRAARVLVATGAGPFGFRLLADPQRVTTAGHIPTHIAVPETFETNLPPVMITTSAAGEFFGGFIAPPVVYPDGHRYIKAVGQTLAVKDQRLVSDQQGGTVRAVERLFPRLVVGSVKSQFCTTLDSRTGRPIVEWIGDRVAVAIAGNGKGVKAALEIGRHAAALVMSSDRSTAGPFQ